MNLFIGHKRKDGKYKVTYAFDNGVRFNKILTPEKIQSEIEKGYTVYKSRKEIVKRG